MASITSLGTGSGLDLEGLVKQLVEAERRPTANRLDLREAEAQAKISAYGSLKSSLSEFKRFVTDLKLLSNLSPRNASSSNPELFTVTASNNAAPGSSSIQVVNLATAHKLVSGNFTDGDSLVGTGVLDIQVGDESFSVEINGGSLTEVRDSINQSAASEKLTASIIQVDDEVNGGTVSKLVLTAKETGAANTIEIRVIDNDGSHSDAQGLSQLFYVQDDPNNQLTEVTGAANARITIDGFSVSSSTNEFKNAIEGVTITAIAAAKDPINDPPATLTVGLDNSALKEKISGFVTLFNSLKGTLNTLTSYNPDSGQAGLLNGDATLRSIHAQIGRILYSPVGNEDGRLNYLSQLGIRSTDAGLLELDNAVLEQAIASDFKAIGELFAGEKGMATQLDDLIAGFLSSAGGLTARQEGLQTRLKNIADDRATLERRVAGVETRFRQQFTNLDILVTQLNSTSEFLIQQLQNTNNIINGFRNSNRK